MLGESHSLLSEFPEFKILINKLNQNDAQFSKMAKHYDDLDTEIRQLELDNAPIGDDAMHKLKHDRAELKDKLYQYLLKAKS